MSNQTNQNEPAPTDDAARRKIRNLAYQKLTKASGMRNSGTAPVRGSLVYDMYDAGWDAAKKHFSGQPDGGE